MRFHSVSVATGLLGLALANSDSLCSQFAGVISPGSKCGSQNQRWSEYAQPQPGAIISVGTESDVSAVVKLANQLDIPYVVQSGANGWANTFTLGSNGVIIDLSHLKAISFGNCTTKAEIRLQAGVLISELVEAAWSHNLRVPTGTCNCVSVLGAGLGGGVGRGTGLYGLGSDNLLKVNLVDANGDKLTVTPSSDPELWWALTGAGANFGIVTSVVYQAYPVAQAANTAWTGLLIFEDSKIEKIISALDALELEPEMQIDFYFTQGMVAVLPFYLGDEATGRKKFASIVDIGALQDNTEVISYNTWNAAGDSFCTKGGRKPTYAANLKKLDPTAWRNVWNEYSAWYNAHAEANQTTILMECYSTTKSLEIGDAKSAYPWRDIKCYTFVIPWYTSAELDDEATEFGKSVRSYWAQSSGTENFSAYINFAHGDEPLSSIYGSSLPKLQVLKQKYDPKGRFNQWFPLS